MINEVNYSEIPKKIKHYLKANGIKINWLTKQTGVNWSDRLNKSRGISIKVDELLLLCKSLNLPPDYFLRK